MMRKKNDNATSFAELQQTVEENVLVSQSGLVFTPIVAGPA